MPKYNVVDNIGNFLGVVDAESATEAVEKMQNEQKKSDTEVTAGSATERVEHYREVRG